MLDPASVTTVVPTEILVMTQVSQPTLPLQSMPTVLPSGSLQEDTTDDDYNFINLQSWISLISDKSTGDLESNSEQNSSDMLLPP